MLSLHGGAQASLGSYFQEHGGVAPSLIKAEAWPATPEEELSPQSGRSGCCENHLHFQTIMVPVAPTPVTSEPPRGCAGWDLKLPDSRMSDSRASQGPERQGLLSSPLGSENSSQLTRIRGWVGGMRGSPPTSAPVEIRASSGASSGTRKPQAGPGAGSVSLEMGRHFCPLFLCSAGLGLLQAPEVVGHLHLPSQVLSLERCALWWGGGYIFEVKYCITARSTKY